MRRETIASLGDPGTFDLTDKTDPLYYIARQAHEQSLNFYNLEAAGFVWEQDEDTDISTIDTAWQNYATSFAAWVDDAVNKSSENLPIPSIPSLPAIPTTTIGGILLQLALKVLVHLGTEWLKKRLDGDTEASEVAQILKRATLKNPDSPQEFSIFELLANVPLEILVSLQDGFKDITYTDRPET